MTLSNWQDGVPQAQEGVKNGSRTKGKRLYLYDSSSQGL